MNGCLLRKTFKSPMHSLFDAGKKHFYYRNQACMKKRKKKKKAWSKIFLLLKSRFFKNRELYWSNLPQNSNLWRESFVQKSGVQIPVGKGQIFCHFSFFFTFFILSIKNWILKHKLPFLYINKLHRNKMEFVQYAYFYWYLIGKRR